MITRSQTGGRQAWRKGVLVILCLAFAISACRRPSDGAFVVALESTPESLDPWRGVDASGERLRQLMFNSLVRKNENFDYVGDLASDIEFSSDRLTATFTIRDNVRFHDGRTLTAADAKYSLDTLLASPSEYKKAPSFFESAKPEPLPYIASVEAPDERTLIIRLRKAWNPLLSNLVAIAIIPRGSAATQATNPIGTGAFSFISANGTQGIYELQGFKDYWQGAPNLERLRLRVILDPNTLQAELRSGRIDLAISYVNFSPDTYKALALTPGLRVQQFPGSNVAYLGFNAQSDFVKDARVRLAIAYAIDRETIVDKLLLGQARVAHSILPEESWAYAPGERYTYNPNFAKQILDEAGYTDSDGDEGQMRFPKPISFKMSSSSATRQYAEVMQNSLRAVGIPVNIETMELTTLGAAQRSGQFQMTTARWVGGNQDPVFLKDLFVTGAAFNRGKYSNPRLDGILSEAIETADREKAKALYTEAQRTVSDEVPMLPLWYPATMIVGKSEVENIRIDASGDWSFLRLVSVKNSQN